MLHLTMLLCNKGYNYHLARVGRACITGRANCRSTQIAGGMRRTSWTCATRCTPGSAALQPCHAARLLRAPSLTAAAFIQGAHTALVVFTPTWIHSEALCSSFALVTQLVDHRRKGLWMYVELQQCQRALQLVPGEAAVKKLAQLLHNCMLWLIA